VTVTALGNDTYDVGNIDIGGNLKIYTVSDSESGDTITLDVETNLYSSHVEGNSSLYISDAGDTLEAKASQINGLDLVSGEGCIHVTDLGNSYYSAANIHLSGELSINTVSSEADYLTLDSATNLIAGEASYIKLHITDNGDTVQAKASQLNGLDCIDGNANLHVTDLGSTAYDASNIWISGELTIDTVANGQANVIILNANTNLMAGEANWTGVHILDRGDTLVANASQLTGLEVWGEASVRINNLGANGAAFDDSNFHIEGNLDFYLVSSAETTITLDAETILGAEYVGGTTTLHLADAGDTLVATAEQLDGLRVLGTSPSHVNISNTTITGHADLTKVLTTTMTFGDGETDVTINSEAYLGVNLGYMHNFIGLGNEVNGQGAINMVGAYDITASDLSHISTDLDVTMTLTQVQRFTGQSGVDHYVLTGANTTAGYSMFLADGGQSVVGSAGNDVIVGGAGDDVMSGGAGKDTLKGNGGADTFSFITGDTGITSSTSDQILDFTTGEDFIKLATSVDNFVQADGLSGNAAWLSGIADAFAGHSGQTTVFASADQGGSGNTWMAVDSNRDGTFNSGDLFIVLNGLTQTSDLNRSDFIV
jgi:hypothetical protein